MPVTQVDTDRDNLTLTITAEFAAPVERVWGIYADPRQLERVWGPPSHPATFVDFDLTPGGLVTYFMTSPEGEKYCGYWRIAEVDAPTGLAFADGFADADFNPITDLPESQNAYGFAVGGAGTVATYRSAFPSAEALEKVLEMGMVEGATEAINQIDDFLAAG